MWFFNQREVFCFSFWISWLLKKWRISETIFGNQSFGNSDIYIYLYILFSKKHSKPFAWIVFFQKEPPNSWVWGFPHWSQTQSLNPISTFRRTIERRKKKQTCGPQKLNLLQILMHHSKLGRHPAIENKYEELFSAYNEHNPFSRNIEHEKD